MANTEIHKEMGGSSPANWDIQDDVDLDEFIDKVLLYWHESRLEAAGNKFTLFFDAAEIISAVKGLYDYFEPPNGLKDDFFHSMMHSSFYERRAHGLRPYDRALICCLALNGFYGPIYVLPPHQHEIKKNIFETHANDLRTNRRNHRLMAQQFFARIKRHPLMSHEPPNPKEKWTAQNRQYYVTLFKVILCVKTWNANLYDWTTRHNASLITGDHSELDGMFTGSYAIEQMIVSDAFKQLNQAFKDLRKEDKWDHSNFADTMALISLRNLVKMSASTKKIPLFFDPRGTFQRCVRDAGMEEDFKFETKSGDRLSIFRDASYFLNRVIIPKKEVVEKDADLETIWKLNREADTRSFQSTREAFNRLWRGDATEPLEEILGEKKNAEFMARVWFPTKQANTKSPSSTSEDVVQSVIDMQPSGENWAHDFRVQRELVTKEFGAALDSYKVAYGDYHSFCQGVDKAASNPANHHAIYMESTDVLRDFGLLQFSLPDDSTRLKIEASLRELCGSVGDRYKIIDEIVGIYLRSKYDTELSVQEISFALTVLSGLKLFKNIIQIYEACERRNSVKDWQNLPYFIRTIYARAILEERPQIDTMRRVSKIQLLLQQEAEKSSEPEYRARIEIALAYLNFKIWEFKGYKQDWLGYEESIPAVKAESDRLISNAVDATQRAIQILSELRQTVELQTGEKQRMTSSEIFAVNMLLYILVEGGEDSLLFQLSSELENVLINYREDQDLWQFRYDDTLGRYYHRLAVYYEKKHQWNVVQECLDMAEQFYKNAQMPIGDLPVSNHNTAFKTYKLHLLRLMPSLST